MLARSITFTGEDLRCINAMNAEHIVIGSYVTHLQETLQGVKPDSEVRIELPEDMLFQAIRAESFCEDESGILYHIASEFVH